MPPGGGLPIREVVPLVERPEVGRETAVEQRPEGRRERPLVDVSRASEQVPLAPQPLPVAPVAQQTKDPVLKKVEEILEEDLGTVYFSLPENLREKFKKRGEAVATAIQTALLSAKVKAGMIAKLIISWLRMIPHVNAFYLEQEAKIKTDTILLFSEKLRTKGL